MLPQVYAYVIYVVVGETSMLQLCVIMEGLRKREYTYHSFIQCKNCPQYGKRPDPVSTEKSRPCAPAPFDLLLWLSEILNRDRDYRAKSRARPKWTRPDAVEKHHVIWRPYRVLLQQSQQPRRLPNLSYAQPQESDIQLLRQRRGRRNILDVALAASGSKPRAGALSSHHVLQGLKDATPVPLAKIAAVSALRVPLSVKMEQKVHHRRLKKTKRQSR